MYRPLAFLKKWRTRADEYADGGEGTADGLDEAGLRTVCAVVSWLIDYPDEQLMDRLPQIRALLAAADLPDGIWQDLQATLDHLYEDDVYRLSADYVETFDTRRRGCLFLTYFTNGDTRRRGQALLEIKEIYRAAGLDMDDAQLPDHLTCVLEFAAGHDLRSGIRILLANRAGLELLRLHLTEIDSPWAGALRALCAILPPLESDDVHAVERLAAEGPAEETVGLDGLGGYGDDPTASAPPTMMPTGTCGPTDATGPDGSDGTGRSSGPVGAAPPDASLIPLTDVTGDRS